MTATRDERDLDAMRRALRLAARGPERDPNPRVGCVILNQSGTIIAEGWHRGAGTSHAEINALSHLNPGTTNGATAVVTLEPCNHHGRTEPCTEALIRAGISRVVYAVADPSEAARGGAERLKAAGIDVEPGVLADEASEFLGSWLPAARLGRPVITLKWASTLDGRIRANDGSNRWITSEDARADLHLRRARFDAIGVGTGTALVDDPTLTARDRSGDLYPRQPIPVVFGKRPLPPEAKLHQRPHILLDGTNLTRDLRQLHQNGNNSLLVEGGPQLISAFLAANLVDELLIYLAPLLVGGSGLATTDIGVGSLGESKKLRFTEMHQLGADVLLIAQPTISTHTDISPEERS